MNERLLSALHQLRLSGLAQSLEIRLQEAAGHSSSHAEFLELILQDELLVRQERQIGRRVKWADFRELKPLETIESDYTHKHSFFRERCSGYSVRHSPSSTGSVAPAVGC